MCLCHPGTKAYEYKKSSSSLCGTPEKFMRQCLVDGMQKKLWQQTLEKASMSRAGQSRQQSSQVSIDAELFCSSSC